MNRIPTTLIITMAALLVAPLAAGGNTQWTTTTERGITTAEGGLVQASWFDGIVPCTVVGISKDGTDLFSLDLAMHDGEGGRIPTHWKTQGNWLMVGQEPEHGNDPGPVGIKIHDVPTLAAKINCNGHPPEPVVPPEPVEPAPCTAVFPEGSTITLAEDGRSFEVQLPRLSDDSPGAKLAWRGFNPQPEPPAVDGNMVSFVGENIHVETA